MDFSGPKLVAVAGGIVTLVAGFLPWITAGVSAGPVDVSTAVAGVDTTPGLVAAILGVVVVGVALGLDWAESGGTATAVGGTAIVLVAVVQLLDIGGIASAGLGLYVTIGAGVVIAAAGLVGHVDGSGSE